MAHSAPYLCIPSLPDGVGAGGAVLADGGADFTFVNVLVAKRAGEIGRTLTVIRVDFIHARTAIFAQVTVAIVDVDLAVVQAAKLVL